MGKFLIIFAYVCYAVFLIRIIWRVILLFKIQEGSSPALQGNSSTKRTSVATIVRAARDIIFLSRLFRTNPVLWFGEWLFHITFILVLIRHLRYVLHAVPNWLLNLQLVGLAAGYILPLSLVYVLIFKLLIERKKYFSTGNFFLLSLLLLLSITGLIMKNITHPDIVDIKIFVSHALSIRFRPAPESLLFIVHFITAFLFLAFLPTHIFAAPLTIIEARKRDDRLEQVIHEK